MSIDPYVEFQADEPVPDELIPVRFRRSWVVILLVVMAVLVAAFSFILVKDFEWLALGPFTSCVGVFLLFSRWLRHPWTYYDPRSNSLVNPTIFGIFDHRTRLPRTPDRGRLITSGDRILLELPSGKRRSPMRQMFTDDDDFLAVHWAIQERHDSVVEPGPPLPAPKLGKGTSIILVTVLVVMLVGPLTGLSIQLVSDREEDRMTDLAASVSLDLCDRERWETALAPFEEAELNRTESDPRPWPSASCDLEVTMDLPSGERLEEMGVSFEVDLADDPNRWTEYTCDEVEPITWRSFADRFEALDAGAPQPLCMGSGIADLEVMEAGFVKGAWIVTARINYGASNSDPTQEDIERIEELFLEAIVPSIDQYPFELID
ncbi:hypothetical protein [Glycomyces buryatensis]|uniref:Uncharacterized protein n=1 Tax=Glycomyces buryatensis TaxID=2570927 RepID=A0A4S8QHH2_9ACTN|nr:hypothetical protein [Glycomyces buryatensis]THV42405.1 hypothetical protein FAB82_07060 [Glycomyces buryatensis]